MDTTPSSGIRKQARTIILQVIADNVRGPVQILPREDVLELRRLLRAAWPWGERTGWKYRVWCQETRSALGYQVKKAKRYIKLQKRREETVMPSMRGWAEKHGMLADPTDPPLIVFPTVAEADLFIESRLAPTTPEQ